MIPFHEAKLPKSKINDEDGLTFPLDGGKSVSVARGSGGIHVKIVSLTEDGETAELGFAITHRAAVALLRGLEWALGDLPASAVAKGDA